MGEVVLATQQQFSKGESVFRAAGQFEIQLAPTEEPALAEAVVAQDCRAVIVGSYPYRGPLYEALGRSGGARGAIIARFGVGHDNVDKRLARQNNIVVTNTPGVLDVSVAEHAMWLLGDLAKHISLLGARFKAGRFAPQTGTEIRGKTLGIIGFGAIGRCVATIAHFGFGMRVLAVDCRPPDELEKQQRSDIDQIKVALGLDLYTSQVEPVLREADFVSVHLPANAETRHFINTARLELMKPEAMLINTARGSVVDEDALYDALAGGRLAAAALDVFHCEPYEPVSPGKDLRTLENVVLTPHTASNTREANGRIAQSALENVSKFFAGRISEMNRVDADS